MKTILFVCGVEDFQVMWGRLLSDIVESVAVMTVEEARKAVAANQDIAVVVVDASVDNHALLISEIREALPETKLVGTATFEEHRAQLVLLGCERVCIAARVPEVVRQVIGKLETADARCA